MAYNPAYMPALPQAPAAPIGNLPCPPVCPPAVIVGTKSFNPNDLMVCFPKQYFDGVKGYLRTLRSSIPMDPVQRVYWALDVWYHVNAALYSLNIPFDGHGGFDPGMGTAKDPVYRYPEGIGGGYAPNRNIQVLQGFLDVYGGQKASLETMRRNEVNKAKREGANPFWLKDAESAHINPTPFMSLIPFWLGMFDRNAGYSGNPIAGIANQYLMPWMQGGIQPPPTTAMQQAKFIGDTGRASRDPAFAKAFLRWQWWSLRDRYPYKAREEWREDVNLDTGRDHWDPTLMPHHMPNVKNMTPLSVYLSRVPSERQADIVFDSGRWFPTVKFACSQLTHYIDIILTAQYDKTVRDHVVQWISISKPPIDEVTGKIKRVPGFDSRAQRTPITMEDYADMRSQMKERINARMQAAITNPVEFCISEATSSAQETFCKGAGSVYTVASKIPVFGQVMKGFQKLAGAIAEALGAAEGWSYIPFHIMNHPFIRSVAAPGWSTLADGSSVDVLKREVIAISAIQERLKIYIAPWSEPSWIAAPPRGTYETVLDKEGNPIQKFIPEGLVEAAAPPCGLVDMWLHQNKMTLSKTDRWYVMTTCDRELIGKTVPAGSTLAMLERIKERTSPDTNVACNAVIDLWLAQHQIQLNNLQRTAVFANCKREAFEKTAAVGSTEAMLEAIEAKLTAKPALLLAPTEKRGVPWGLLALVGAGAAGIILLTDRGRD